MIRPFTASSDGSYRRVHSGEVGKDRRAKDYDPGVYQHIPDNDHDDRASLDHLSGWPEPELSYRGRKKHHEEPSPFSASREGSIPLSHPTPDLQSLQGAYVGNVKRLEQSAERLSLGSDIGEELRKLQMEQKRSENGRSSIKVVPSRQYSSTSHTDSILGYNSVARSGGFSHEGYVTSPMSMRSPTWSLPSTQEQASRAGQQNDLTEPRQEGKPLDSPTSNRPSIRMVQQNDQVALAEEEEIENKEGARSTNDETSKDRTFPSPALLQRNTSAASGDTFQKASMAFADFDGVHIPSDLALPEPEQPRQPGRLEEPVERRQSVSPAYSATFLGYEIPQPGPGMVYYPAPVPAILNLPEKLSKRAPLSIIEKRRTQLLSSRPRKVKSMASLSGLLEGDGSIEGESEKLPPQLRATMFFEHPSITHDLEIINGSAVATLDRLLDAAADAPVSAFTDHPIIGQVGAEVYGRSRDPRRSQNSSDLLKSAQKPERRSFLPFTGIKKRTTASNFTVQIPMADNDEQVVIDKEAALRHTVSDEVEDEDAEEGVDNDDLEADRPTTLLAELQMRKQQQQKRNRTAATAFPDGMRSTLLQLDAVAQIQKQSRKHKHVTLAWENADEDVADDDENDEVPLGMLYPNGKPSFNEAPGRFDEDKPLGLLAQRSMEDNEPLSARRARLRGEPIPLSNAAQERNTSMFNLEIPGVTTDAASEENNEEETLAQRKQRLGTMGAERKSRRISGDFASEVLSQFGVKEEVAPVKDGTTPDPEETLGQRRKRLQAENRRSGDVSRETAAIQPQKRKSMADLLQANPVGGQTTPHQSLPARGLIAASTWHPSISKENQTYQSQRYQTFGPGFYNPNSMPYERQVGNDSGVQNQSLQPQAGQYVNPMTYTPMMGLRNPAGATPQLPNLAPIADHLPLDPRQRAMIDRWRQSVL